MLGNRSGSTVLVDCIKRGQDLQDESYHRGHREHRERIKLTGYTE
jgi:hypothetical protein